MNYKTGYLWLFYENFGKSMFGISSKGFGPSLAI
jgi:hypothetical protein